MAHLCETCGSPAELSLTEIESAQRVVVTRHYCKAHWPQDAAFQMDSPHEQLSTNQDAVGEGAMDAEAAYPVLRALHAMEGWLGMFFANVFALFLLLMIGFALYEPMTLPMDLRAVPAGVVACVAVGWLVLDVPYLFRLWKTALRGGRPIAFVTAANQPMWPIPLRGIPALWWFGHFALGAWFSIGSSELKSGAPVLMRTFVFFICTCYGIAANGYLMMSICALTRSPVMRYFVWNRRLLIDILLGLAGSMLLVGTGE